MPLFPNFQRTALLSALLLAPLAMQAASTATITFLGAPTGVNDGFDFVEPYQVSIDQGLGGATVTVVCYDSADSISVGETWTANLFNLAGAAAFGYFSGGPNPLAAYREVAWLSNQTYSNTDQQVALQHAIWDIFGVSSPEQNAQQTADLAAYQSAVAAAAAGGYTGFDFSHFVFIEQVGGVVGQPGTTQALVYDQPTTNIAPTPEPGTLAMIGGGLALLMLFWRRAGMHADRSR